MIRLLLANLARRMEEVKKWWGDQIDPVPLSDQKKQSWGTTKNKDKDKFFRRAWTTEHYSWDWIYRDDQRGN